MAPIVLAKTLGVESNVQRERAKRKGVPAELRNERPVMHCVGWHLQCVGAPRTACGLVRGGREALCLNGWVRVPSSCGSGRRGVAVFTHRVCQRASLVGHSTSCVARGIAPRVNPNDMSVGPDGRGVAPNDGRVSFPDVACVTGRAA